MKRCECCQRQVVEGREVLDDFDRVVWVCFECMPADDLDNPDAPFNGPWPRERTIPLFARSHLR